MSTTIKSEELKLKLFRRGTVRQTITDSFTAYEFKVLLTLDITGLDASKITVFAYSNYRSTDPLYSYIYQVPYGTAYVGNVAAGGTTNFAGYYKIVNNAVQIGLVNTSLTPQTIIAPYNDAVIYYSIFYF